MAFLFSGGFCDSHFERPYQKIAPAPEVVLCLTYFRKSTVSTRAQYLNTSSLLPLPLQVSCGVFPPTRNYKTLCVTLCPHPKVLTPSERNKALLLWGQSVTNITLSLIASDLH